MTNKTKPLNTIFIVSKSQEIVADIKVGIDSGRPLSREYIQHGLDLVYIALEAALRRISELTQYQKETQDTLSQAEHQASDLMDSLNKLVKDNKALTAIEAATIAKELYGTIEGLYFLLGSGVEQ